MEKLEYGAFIKIINTNSGIEIREIMDNIAAFKNNIIQNIEKYLFKHKCTDELIKYINLDINLVNEWINNRKYNTMMFNKIIIYGITQIVTNRLQLNFNHSNICNLLFIHEISDICMMLSFLTNKKNIIINDIILNTDRNFYIDNIYDPRKKQGSISIYVNNDSNNVLNNDISITIFVGRETDIDEQDQAIIKSELSSLFSLSKTEIIYRVEYWSIDDHEFAGYSGEINIIQTNNNKTTFLEKKQKIFKNFILNYCPSEFYIRL